MTRKYCNVIRLLINFGTVPNPDCLLEEYCKSTYIICLCIYIYYICTCIYHFLQYGLLCFPTLRFVQLLLNPGSDLQPLFCIMERQVMGVVEKHGGKELSRWQVTVTTPFKSPSRQWSPCRIEFNLHSSISLYKTSQ